MTTATKSKRRLVIHPTQDQTYQTCPRKFKFAVIDRLVPREPVPALAVGSLGHKALARYYKDGTDPAQAFREAYEEWTNSLEQPVTEKVKQQADSVHKLLSLYPEFAQAEDRWAVWYVEQPFEVVIYADDEVEVVLRGRFDLVVHADGAIWITDHKFYSRFPAPRLIHIDTQFTNYVLAARLIWPDLPIGGIVPNLFHKEMPKSKKTQPFARHWVAKTDTQLINARKHLLRRLKRALEDWEEGEWTPNTGFHCANCPFYNLCVEMDRGGDVDSLIELSYTRNEDVDFGWEEEEAA